jgi:hypothetical protein
MRLIHVLRKPLSEGTVAANTLKHGTGEFSLLQESRRRLR